MREFKISVEPQFCVLMAAMLILLPVPLVIAWLTASMVHELFHCLALGLCGKRISYILIGCTGAKIEVDELSYQQAAFCALAGPTGGMILILAAKWFPLLSACGLIQSAYNLLPVFSFDGAIALRSIAHLLLSAYWAEKLCTIVAWSVIVCIVLLGIAAAFVWNCGYLPLMLAVVFLARMIRIKIPCK